jgi:VanZ family protein
MGIVAVIVHGSLYPYAFRVPRASAGALATLLASWSKPPTSFGDLVANILLYLPLGFFGVQALRAPRRLLAVTLFGLLLCIGIELMQFYDESRVTNMSDVYLNTLGTWLGGLAGMAVGDARRRVFAGLFPSESVACLLLVALLGYRLFPFVPVIDLHKYWRALKPVLLHPSFAPWPIFHYFTLWLTVCYLIAAIVGQRFVAAAVFLFAAFVFSAKIAIVNLAVTMPEIVGMLSALVVWFALLNRSRASAPVIAVLLCAMIVAFRLAPFAFDAAARPFGWVPFRSFLEGSLDVNIVSFLEKFFLYGSLIWIGCKAGLRIWMATGATVSLLLATSLAETHLPGRSAEITDAAMALLIGGIFATMIAARDSQSLQRGASAPKV